ncbi:MAG: RdgB/HAM1 family non-canonical purine NTP pyrophosphatase [Myxococcales bacterium]|nr:RdgB/HAM1 family non-canonical purine NTP pyrophosphatase [Myxococcales bacterium]
MRILFATSNPGKIREVTEVLGPLGVEVVGLDSLESIPEEPEETETTFEGNARLKALYYAKTTNYRCLAEDSGLEVDALDGAPGVFSARYAGAQGTREEKDQANNKKLLGALVNIPMEQRTARFVCAMCVADPDGSIVAETQGRYEGLVADGPRGSGGFGYDPLLYLPDVGKTSAELSPEDKNARSHRGHAARALAKLLERLAPH